MFQAQDVNQIRPTSTSMQACKGKITELYARWMSSAQGEIVIQTLIRETVAASKPHHQSNNQDLLEQEQSNQAQQQLQFDEKSSSGNGGIESSGGVIAARKQHIDVTFDVNAAESRRVGNNTTMGTKFFQNVDEIDTLQKHQREHSPGASSPVSPGNVAGTSGGSVTSASGSGGGINMMGGREGSGGKIDLDPSLPRAAPPSSSSSPELNRSPGNLIGGNSNQVGGAGAGGQRFVDPIPMNLDSSLTQAGSGSTSQLPSPNAQHNQHLQQPGHRSPGRSGGGGGVSDLSASQTIVEQHQKYSTNNNNQYPQAVQQQQQQRQIASYADIPQFHFPRGPPSDQSSLMSSQGSTSSTNSSSSQEESYRILTSFFAPPGTRSTATSLDVAHRGLKRAAIGPICSDVFDVPAWLRGVVFKKMLNLSQLPDNGPNTQIRIGEAKRLLDQLSPLSNNRRLFEVIKGAGGGNGSGNNNNQPHHHHHQFQKGGGGGTGVITFDDLFAMVRSVVDFHSGLEFLTQEEFQNAYCKTVAYRILFNHDSHGSRTITWPEFNRSRLPEVLRSLDSIADINQVLEYFSYEHFYVLYCRFWELDQDKDLHINLTDLKEYNMGSVSVTALERVMQGKGRKLTSTRPGYLNFEDFVYFCLAEEDKTSDAAKKYWFGILDIDGDGVLSGYELNYFFEEQRPRFLEATGPENPLKLEDLMCQTLDIISPSLPHQDGVRLEDIRKCESSVDVFFNLFVNALKFLNFENRDPFEEFRSKQNPEKTPWDRFARAEYDRLAQEALQN